MADDKSRINKLEARSREAEASLQQLKAYIDLLRTKKAGIHASTCCIMHDLST